MRRGRIKARIFIELFDCETKPNRLYEINISKAKRKYINQLKIYYNDLIIVAML